MKVEKMNIEVEKTVKEQQGSRLNAYRDKLRELRKDTASEREKTGDSDGKGREKGIKNLLQVLLREGSWVARLY